MSINANLTEFVTAHSTPPAGMTFYPSRESVQTDERLLGYVSVIERAWDEMRLNGVLCLDGRPILYLKEYSRLISAPERIKLQRLFWNQGVANVLVLADLETVYIYSGLAKPLKDLPDEEALVDTLEKVVYASEIQAFYHRLATGYYYETKQAHFNPNKSVDKYLLNNLEALRNRLIEGKEGLEIKEAHAFIGRVLFLCYLLDRGIYYVGETKPGQTGTTVFVKELESRPKSEWISYLYDLFNDLKEKFNGNMFDQDLDVEKCLIQNEPSRLDYLVRFLGGHNVGSGQQTLGFWAYDFKMIPVETISAIYQDFLAKEDPERQQKRGAIYTPRFLAEMVVDMAMQDNPDALKWSYLDPSCGSGIFLVILFNRLARRWVLDNPKCHYITTANELQKILKHQIRGVDIEETACRIACFSLYLAYLDFFKPPDIQRYIKITKKRLPKLLDYGDTPDRPVADIRVICRADFRDKETLAGEVFDCVIGNPPWEGRGRKQLAQKFMEKTPHFMRKSGVGCFLLPSKIFQNQTDTFQSKWLREVTLEKVLQLADYSFLLFQQALCPAFIARFSNVPPEIMQHKVDFIAPKFNREGLRQGIIAINPSARTLIPLTDILSAAKSNTAPIVWKRHLWGTLRDQKLLDFLQSLPQLSDSVGRPKEGKRWIKGQGFQPNSSGKSKNPKHPFWKNADLYIDANAFFWDSKGMVLGTDDCEEVGDRFPSLHRPRDPLIYKAPLVLVSQGFGKVAFCDFDVLFQDSLQSIAGPKNDSELLMFLAAYLRSKLAKYFLFHTAANWGSERDKVHLHELLRVPLPLPGDESATKDAGKIVKQVANKVKTFRDRLVAADSNSKQNEFKLREDDGVTGRKKLVDNLQKEIEPLIYEYFGLTKQEIILVEDTMNVFEPSSTPSNWWSKDTVTLDSVEHTKVENYANQGLKAYADTLANTLNEWAKLEFSGHRVSANGGIDNETGLAMVTLNLVDEEVEYQQKQIRRNLASVLKSFQSRISRKQGALLYERNILIFIGERVHIIRPSILLNWTRTAALNDAARIFGDIALSQQG